LCAIRDSNPEPAEIGRAILASLRDQAYLVSDLGKRGLVPVGELAGSGDALW
jgi:hypothetical protein